MDLVQFLGVLDEHRTSYRLDRVRDAVMVVVATPGRRWEVEFMDDGTVEVERFQSDGTVAGDRLLSELLTELD